MKGSTTETEPYGIAAELQQVMGLAMGDASNLKQMLGVAKALLQKSISGRADSTEAAEAALAVVAAVADWMEDDKSFSTGVAALNYKAASKLRATASRLLASRATGKPVATTASRGRPQKTAMVFGTPLAISGSEGSRQAIIEAGSRAYDVERGRGRVLCNRQGFVNLMLRDRGLSRLTESERLSIAQD